MGKEKKYWRGLEELANSPEFLKHQQNEFTEEVPVDKFLSNESLSDGSTSRRDFLKFLGFSVTAATLASCETPVNKTISYIVKPEEITPGVANYYASTYFDGQDYASILVKTREGRPIKIEGNELSPVTMGATNARVQASVLSLYDSSRITGPKAKGQDATWETVDKEIGTKLAEITAAGGNVRILSSTIISPSTKQVVADFVTKYPTTKHITHDAVSYSGIAKANWHSFEKRAIPSYYFDKAKVIVSIGADFLGNWLSPIEFAKQYGKGRKVTKEHPEMAKHIQFEANMSLTGANADERYPVKPSMYGAVATALYNAISANAGVAAVDASKTPYDTEIAELGKLLWENKKKALVVCGSNDEAIQVIVNSINTLLDSYENTIDLRSPSRLRQGNDDDFIALVNEMKEGKVAALICYNTNPVYTSAGALQFSEAYKKVALRVSFSDKMDETASISDYVCPDHHYLESWNDAEPKMGQYSFTQPTIAPLFSKATGHAGTRQAQESLLTWSGNKTDFYSYIKKRWSNETFGGNNTPFSSLWNKMIQDGVFSMGLGVSEMIAGVAENEKEKNFLEKIVSDLKPKNNKKVEASKPSMEATSILGATMLARMDIASAAAKVNKYSAKEGSDKFELALYEKVGIGNGNQGNNPWLQEFPDPISKVTWDNYVTMSPIDMKEKGYKLQERQDREASVITVTLGNTTVTNLPVYPQPGQARGTIGIALGYGRDIAGAFKDKAGIIGQNAYPLLQVTEGAVQYNVSDITLTEETGTTELASTQVHHTIMGRNLVRETTLEEYKADARAGNEEEKLMTHAGPKDPITVTLWDEHDRPGHKWGMAIDLNSCIGCGSCVVSCNAENNVAVVGKDQVRRSREMHWLRIDRYYTSDMTEHKAEEEHIGAIDMYLQMENPTMERPKVMFQPVMCQHCNHAPCENVCPVIATSHSSDGLNHMTYNRCVGTRYCANNCPFKVRRFNWFNYNGNSDFATINPAQDDLGRMVLNPDVVVRSRGVMEKCSMCIQRIQAGKLDAKKAMTKLQDGAIKTACQQGCPTNAITFGDLNDESSQISAVRKDERNYFMLHELNIQPTVSYLVKVRNTKAEAHTAHHDPKAHAEHASEKHGEEAHTEAEHK